MKDNTHIAQKIESVRPQLSSEDRVQMWQQIKTQLPVPVQQRPIPSPFITYSFLRKTMAPIAVLLVIILGGGTTALAADAARPGDLLFPLDRSIENARLSLALSEEGRQELLDEMTEERLLELREIIDEEVSISPTNAVGGTSNASTTIDSLEIEAHVFTDTTVVRIEIGGQKFYFETDANTLIDAITEIQSRFPILTNEIISHVLRFEVEERASRPKDRGVVFVTEDGQERINLAVVELLDFLEKTNSDSNAIAVLAAEIDGVIQKTRVTREHDEVRIGDEDDPVEIRINDDGSSSVEVRDEDVKVRVATEGGEVTVSSDTHTPKVEVEAEVEDEEETLEFEVEAEVYTDTTIITLEFAGDVLVFETTAKTRTTIVDDVHERFPALTKEQLDAYLVVKTEGHPYHDDEEELIEDTADIVETAPVTQNTERHDEDEEEYEEEDEEEYEDEDEYEEEYEEEDEEDERDDEEDEEDERDDEEDEEDEDDEEEEEED